MPPLATKQRTPAAYAATVAALLLAGCFRPSFKDNIACGANDTCPPGTSCGTDGLCHAPGGGSDPTTDGGQTPTGGNPSGPPGGDGGGGAPSDGPLPDAPAGPPPFETIKSGLRAPFYVVSGPDGFVYYTTQGGFMQDNGTVERALKTGGGGGALIGGQPDPTRLILAGNFVYWQDARNGGTSAVALDGTLVGNAAVDSQALATDGIDVYIAGNSGVFKVAIGTVSPATMIVPRDTNTPFSVLADAAAVYWAEVVVTDGKFTGSIVRKRDKATGAITTLAPSSPYVERIVMDADYIYGAVPSSAPTGTADNGAIVRIPIAGGGHEVMASGQDAWGLEVDADHVYWVNHWISDGTILRCAKAAPCTPEVVLQDAHALHLAQDATHIYWTSNAGAVRRKAKP